MAKIEKTGSYKDEAGNYFVGKAGDNKPDGWTYHGPTEGLEVDDEKGATEGTVVDTRAMPSAPENRMEPSPENRGKSR